MTWIVGMPAMFGYSVGISDIRVTLEDKSEVDCLQKIYPIANSIALGFAGSVRIGFRMVNVAREWLRCDLPGHAWRPLETVDLFTPIARDVFVNSPVEDQTNHCHLMMLSVDPERLNGPWPQPYVHIFKSPDFAPLKVENGKSAAIGSGSFIPQFQKYVHAIGEDLDRRSNLMQAEVMNPGGMGAMLGFTLTRMLKETNPR